MAITIYTCRRMRRHDNDSKAFVRRDVKTTRISTTKAVDYYRFSESDFSRRPLPRSSFGRPSERTPPSKRANENCNYYLHKHRKLRRKYHRSGGGERSANILRLTIVAPSEDRCVDTIVSVKKKTRRIKSPWIHCPAPTLTDLDVYFFQNGPRGWHWMSTCSFAFLRFRGRPMFLNAFSCRFQSRRRT